MFWDIVLRYFSTSNLSDRLPAFVSRDVHNWDVSLQVIHLGDLACICQYRYSLTIITNLGRVSMHCVVELFTYRYQYQWWQSVCALCCRAVHCYQYLRWQSMCALCYRDARVAILCPSAVWLSIQNMWTCRSEGMWAVSATAATNQWKATL